MHNPHPSSSQRCHGEERAAPENALRGRTQQQVPRCVRARVQCSHVLAGRCTGVHSACAAAAAACVPAPQWLATNSGAAAACWLLQQPLTAETPAVLPCCAG